MKTATQSLDRSVLSYLQLFQSTDHVSKKHSMCDVQPCSNRQTVPAFADDRYVIFLKSVCYRIMILDRECLLGLDIGVFFVCVF